METKRIDDLVAQAHPAWENYQLAGSELAARVSDLILGRADRAALLGGNQAGLLRMNHDHHVRFMANVFGLPAAELLVHTVPWVYRAYLAQGVKADYWPVAFDAWRAAVQEILDEESARQIVPVYDFLAESHEEMVEAARAPLPEVERTPLWDEEIEPLLLLLLEGNMRAVQEKGVKATQRVGLASFYDRILRPAMVQVGLLWERGEISVAREHLASSVAAMLMGELYRRIPAPPAHGKKAVVATVDGEFHQLGARMVADVLEEGGLDVLFLGASTPARELVRFVVDESPQALLLSCSMSFNLLSLKDTVAALRRLSDGTERKIYVGGQALALAPELWRVMGADGSAASADEAREEICGDLGLH